MLITFKSKVAADVLMYQEHAKPLLDLLHKELARGVFTAEEMGGAIVTLEAHIAENKAQPGMENTAADEEDAFAVDQPSSAKVALSVRAYPLLEMLRAAYKEGAAVVWGV